MNKLLSGKTAIVTGASSGMGYATALTLARAGAAVVINARRRERLKKLAAGITAHGVRVSLVMPGITNSEFQKVASYDENSFGVRRLPRSAHCWSRRPLRTVFAGCSHCRLMSTSGLTNRS